MTLRSFDAGPRRSAARRARALSLKFLVAVLVLCATACGRRKGSDPFLPEPGSSAGAAGEGGSGGEGGASDVPDDPELGGPCVDEPQCDDGIDCTADSCDFLLARCRHVPSDAVCDDGIYCNGVETCDIRLDCRAGEVVSCGDLITCTIDTCVEETQSCLNELRDADGDGDPTFDCTGGDCDDTDPYVSSEVAERCGNGRDDDCDGATDETDCVEPQYDRCSDALEIEETGSYEISMRGADLDYPVSCEVELGKEPFRDAVLAITVPEGDALDVSVVATVTEGELVLAAPDRCRSGAKEKACEVGVTLPDGTHVARLFFHGAEPGALSVIVATNTETTVIVRVDYRAATPAPENETCGTAAPLTPGAPVRAVLSGVERSIESQCETATGDLLYSFELEETSDVRLHVVGLDDYGSPVVSLRSESCTELESELTCRGGTPRELFARALPAGSYRVGLLGTGPVEAELTLEVSPPTEALPGEGCSDAPLLEQGKSQQVTLSNRPDAIQAGCLTGAPDAAFTFEVKEASDVLLVTRGAVIPSRCSASNDCLPGDFCNLATAFCESRTSWFDETYAQLIATSPCGPGEALACTFFAGTVRTLARNVPPGDFRAVVENTAGKPASVTAFLRPASSAVQVPRADECETAVLIPETGGRFEGTTRNAFADYSASCDYGGQDPGGAPEQMLKLSLEKPRRMVFDMRESSFATLLVVRDASSCPGEEIPDTCAPGYGSGRSFLDIELAAGSYWVQIDGYDGASGRWALDVFSAELP